ncbi:MAG TPA: hypothetical protein VFN67_13890 [Polyangiales bacterium]|nr:hypothetical protein [Polyangiales bacterium]
MAAPWKRALFALGLVLVAICLFLPPRSQERLPEQVSREAARATRLAACSGGIAALSARVAGRGGC